MCLAQGQNTVTPVRLEPTTPGSRVKHSTTEAVRSPLKSLLWIKGIKIHNFLLDETNIVGTHC